MVWWLALLVTLASCVEYDAIKPNESEGLPPPCKARKIIAGRFVNRYVPMEYLPSEESVEFLLELHYRLIGPNLRPDDEQLIAALQDLYARLNTITHFHVRIRLKPGTLVTGASETLCSQSIEDLEGRSCFSQSFNGAEKYGSVDLDVITGVTRATVFPEIGEKEWTYNRMMETALRDKGFVLRVVTLSMTTYPHQVNILKHIPLTPLYAEETVIQLEGRQLLPIDLAKQNVLMASLDSVGLNSLMGVGWLDFISISQSSDSTVPATSTRTAPFVPSSANITLRTMRDRPGGSIGQALQNALPRLWDQLDGCGVLGINGHVVSSRQIFGYTPQDRIENAQAKGDKIKAFDLRSPDPGIVPYPLPTGRVDSTSVNIVLVITSAILGAAVILLSFKVARQKQSVSEAESHRSFKGLDIQSSLIPRGGLAVESLRDDSLVMPASLQLRLSSLESQESGNHGSSIGVATPVQRDFLMPSGMRQAQSLQAIGDSATEAAGKGRTSGRSRSLKLKAELEKVASLKSWEIPAASIQICANADRTDHLLGEGGFGKVYKGVKGGVQDVAVKVMSDTEELEAQKFLLEIQLLKSISFDRNIVQFYGAVLDTAHPMLILELMEGGNLWAALNGLNHKDFLWNAKGQAIAMDIVRGLVYLHDQRVIHGDLKTKNVLLTKDLNMAKLSDVGLSRVLTTTINSEEGFSSGAPGTFAYAAPELILGKRCTFKADIYSLGILLWEICTHESPRRGQLRDLDVPNDCPQEVASLISQCQEAQPDDRPSIRGVFEVLKRN